MRPDGHTTTLSRASLSAAGRKCPLMTLEMWSPLTGTRLRCRCNAGAPGGQPAIGGPREPSGGRRGRASIGWGRTVSAATPIGETISRSVRCGSAKARRPPSAHGWPWSFLESPGALRSRVTNGLWPSQDDARHTTSLNGSGDIERKASGIYPGGTRARSANSDSSRNDSPCRTAQSNLNRRNIAYSFALGSQPRRWSV